MRLKIKRMINAGFFCALICVGAWIKVPLPFLPMTLQLFAVNTAILAQRGRYPAMSLAAYISLGLIGVPVFAGGGGFGYLLTPGFGYIMGFFAAALLSPLLPRHIGYAARSALNLATVYLCALPYFYALSHLYLNTYITIPKLIVYGCLVFLPSDVIGLALSVSLVTFLGRRRLLEDNILSSEISSDT